MVNISNEGWFGESSEFDQMMAMSVFRAVEVRRTLFRCTNTGISCLIGPLGRFPGPENRIVKNGKDRGVEGVLSRPVLVCSARTLYARLGDTLPKCLVLLQILLIVLTELRGRLVTKEP
jgi:apolipoprotein N-acyltransferase